MEWQWKGKIMNDATMLKGLADAYRKDRDRLQSINADLLAALERFAGAMQQRSYPELQGIACDAFAAIARAKGQA